MPVRPQSSRRDMQYATTASLHAMTGSSHSIEAQHTPLVLNQLSDFEAPIVGCRLDLICQAGTLNIPISRGGRTDKANARRVLSAAQRPSRLTVLRPVRWGTTGQALSRFFAPGVREYASSFSRFASCNKAFARVQRLHVGRRRTDEANVRTFFQRAQWRVPPDCPPCAVLYGERQADVVRNEVSAASSRSRIPR